MNNFWKNKKVLVTGHTGFKGTWLIFLLNKLGAKIFGYSNHKSYFFKNGKIKLPFIIDEKYDDILNLNSLKKYLNKTKPQIIFHLAAQPIVSLSYKYPKKTFETNAFGTLNLLDAASDIKSIKSIIVITSDKVYKNDYQSKKFSENDPLGGEDAYSASKAAAEIITNSYTNIYKFRKKIIGLATVRAGNVIGGGDWAIDRLIPDIILNKFENKKLQIRNPKFVRPWQHVLDPLYGYILLAEKLYKNPNNYSSSWNFGPNFKNRSVQDVIKFFYNHNYKYEVKNKLKISESKLLNLSSSKSKSRLKWSPKYNFNKSLVNTYEWYKNFYSNKSNIYKFTQYQIDNYFKKII